MLYYNCEFIVISPVTQRYTSYKLSQKATAILSIV